MQWSDIQFDPPRRTLREFGGLSLAFFGGMAAWQYFARGHSVAAVVLAALALTIGPLGLIWPRAVRPIYVGWMILAFPIGWVVSRIVLAALYLLIITPMAVAFRLSGRDPLRLARPKADTYWTAKPTPTDLRRYFRQFS